jgi:ADP-dependent NAD(P)H-hydrate dehydratase
MSPSRRAETSPVPIDADVLRSRPLPDHGTTSGKDDRGSVLVVGGTAQTPGGVELAGLAVLRAGAGRIHVATVASVAPPLAVRFPEARVTALPEAAGGEIDSTRLDELEPALRHADVVVVGTGAGDPRPVDAIVERVAEICSPACTVVFDAAAVAVLGARPEVGQRIDGRAVVIPNVVEMAVLLGLEVDAVRADPQSALDQAIERHRVPIALRDAHTLIGDPSGRRFVNCLQVPGLGTPGSGDVLAGVVAGLIARGAEPLTALLWAVHGHAVAGSLVRDGRLGLLAREIVHRIPDALDVLGGRPPNDAIDG